MHIPPWFDCWFTQMVHIALPTPMSPLTRSMPTVLMLAICLFLLPFFACLPVFPFISPLVPVYLFLIMHGPNPIPLYCMWFQHHIILLFLIQTITCYCSLRYNSTASSLVPHSHSGTFSWLLSSAIVPILVYKTSASHVHLLSLTSWIYWGFTPQCTIGWWLSANHLLWSRTLEHLKHCSTSFLSSAHLDSVHPLVMWT